ncbi:hypothetical protein D3C86_1486570 [compost metagenome]
MWAGTDSIPFNQFQAKSKRIKEGPGLNISGFVEGADSLVLHYSFDQTGYKDLSIYQRGKVSENKVALARGTSGKSLALSADDSFIRLPLKEIGYNYTVSFQIKPAGGSKGEKILFSSRNGTFKSADKDNKLGFSREGYHYQFDYRLPEGVWTTITITGTSKGTTLFVNGLLKEAKAGKEILYPETKAKMFKVETLVFPLQFLGSKSNAFQGNIDNLKIFNKVLSEQEIKSLHPKSI